MNNFAQGIYNLVTKIQPIIYLLAAAVIVIIGGGCICPFESVKKFCIKHIPFVVIGVGVVLLALPIAKEIVAAFTF